jgi:hypothetical protein
MQQELKHENSERSVPKLKEIKSALSVLFTGTCLSPLTFRNLITEFLSINLKTAKYTEKMQRT